MNIAIAQKEFHEVANLFPLIEGQEFEELVKDIKENGLQQPIWTYQGKIIDGRNRYRACMRAGIEPRFQEWDGKGSLVAFSVSLNVKRRHLTPSQLSVIALSVEKQLSVEAAERQNLGQKIDQGLSGRSAHQAADMLGTNHEYVSTAKRIEKSAPELLSHIAEGTLTIPDAKAIASLPQERRTKVVKKAIQRKEEEGKRVSSAVREAIWEEQGNQREQKRIENHQLVAQSRSLDEALSVGAKFSTIVVDPPWDWGDEGDVDQFGRGRPTYGTMSLEQLLQLPVGAYADEDCHLYLWITNRSLPKGFQLLDAWGFRYVTCVTWVKPYFGMGNYFRGQTEHLLFGVKGSQPLKRHDAGTVFEAPRGPNGHSSKPIKSYELIESCSPGPYLELFARSQRPDWASWGAEA